MKKSEKWSSLLARTRLSDWLVDEAVAEAKGAIDTDLERELRAEIVEKTQIASLKKAVRAIKKFIPAELCKELAEELAEISKDFTWAKSKRGQYIMEVNDWHQPFHAEFRALKKFEDILIGCHIEQEVVFIAGKVSSRSDFDELLEYVAAKNPPRKILTKVTILDEI